MANGVRHTRIPHPASSKLCRSPYAISSCPFPAGVSCYSSCRCFVAEHHIKAVKRSSSLMKRSTPGTNALYKNQLRRTKHIQRPRPYLSNCCDLFTNDASRVTFHARPWHPSCSSLVQSSYRRSIMSRSQWLLLGAILIGVAVVLYLVFFCPTDCH